MDELHQWRHVSGTDSKRKRAPASAAIAVAVLTSLTVVDGPISQPLAAYRARFEELQSAHRCGTQTEPGGLH